MTQNKIQDYVDNNMTLKERQDFEKAMAENPILREEVEQLQALTASLDKIRLNKKLLKAKQKAASINKSDRIFKTLLGVLGILVIGAFVKILANKKNGETLQIQQEATPTLFHSDTIAQTTEIQDTIVKASPKKQAEHKTPLDKRNHKREKTTNAPKPIASIEKTAEDNTGTIFRSVDVEKAGPSPFIDFPDFIPPSEALRDSCSGTICTAIDLLKENKADSALLLIKGIEDLRAKNILQGTALLLKGEYKSARQVFNRVNYDETDLPVLLGLAWSYKLLEDEYGSQYYFDIIEKLKKF